MSLYKDGDFSIAETDINDIIYLKDHLREEDVQEIIAMSNSNPGRELALCWSTSMLCHTMFLGDKPIAMFGLIEDAAGERANLFFLGTADLEKTKKAFLKSCRVFVAAMLKIFPELYNYVDARYEKSVRWVRWLGAEVKDAVPYGANGMPFHEITFKRMGA